MVVVVVGGVVVMVGIAVVGVVGVVVVVGIVGENTGVVDVDVDVDVDDAVVDVVDHDHHPHHHQKKKEGSVNRTHLGWCCERGKRRKRKGKGRALPKLGRLVGRIGPQRPYSPAEQGKKRGSPNFPREGKRKDKRGRKKFFYGQMNSGGFLAGLSVNDRFSGDKRRKKKKKKKKK